SPCVDDQRSQLWRFQDTGNGLETITNEDDGMVLDVQGQSRQQGATVVQSPRAPGSASQLWREVRGPQSDQYVNVNSGLLLDVRDGSREPGAPVVQSARTGGDHQSWLTQGNVC